jgi:hypothetical protein
MRAVAQTLIVLGLVCDLQGQVTLKFCDLLNNPQKYIGKQVTVRATHRYGFEWSQLYCIDCLDRGKAWLDFSEELDKSSERALKRIPKAGIVNLTVTGVFSGPGEYGHMGGYRYRFVANKVESVAVISKGMKPPEVESAAEKRWACGGTEPK